MEQETFKKLLNTNLLPLAFVGDSVHTLFVREYVLSTPNRKIENYHTVASMHCKASSQAKALEYITPLLTEEESEIVRRGRNAKPKHHAKNAERGQYSHATAFEVLIGWLHLSNQKERLNEILALSIKAIENKGN
ncbi:MAG: Mini-ribonuclease 3 [Clostridia bacterium]|nr:Mini-ribonuclease 3 [Clostridia bacterium]